MMNPRRSQPGDRSAAFVRAPPLHLGTAADRDRAGAHSTDTVPERG